MHPLTPQEKKRLSYQRDGRDVYGENDKASRKNLPKKKRRLNRAYRHQANTQVRNPSSAGEDVFVQPPLSPGRSQIKYPDQRLGEYVVKRIRRRVNLGIEQAEHGQQTIAKIIKTARLSDSVFDR